MKMASCHSIKSLLFEQNWPFESSSPFYEKEEVRKVLPISDWSLPLGLKLFSPQGVVITTSKPVLSHRFAGNIYQEDKFDKLSSIKSLGDFEQEDTEYKMGESPLLPHSRKNEVQTPLSRFAPTPSSFSAMKRQIQSGALTPGSRPKKASFSGESEISPFDKRGLNYQGNS